MNNEEARLILQAYRTGGQDAGDALMAEALEQVRRDPELQKWFAQEQALDLRLRARLEIVVPPELKASLLALPKMTQPARVWHRPMWLAAAAAVLLLVGITALMLWPEHSGQLDSFRNTMARYAMSQRAHIVFEASDMTPIQQWLQARGIESNFELPGGLRGQPAEGCRVVEWNGRKAALICFVLDGRHHVDLFVMDSASLPGLADNSSPQFAQAGGVMTAVWANSGKAYLLAAGGDKEFLQKLLQKT